MVAVAVVAVAVVVVVVAASVYLCLAQVCQASADRRLAENLRLLHPKPRRRGRDQPTTQHQDLKVLIIALVYRILL